ncbi:lamin tail domain-containing protein [Ancylomarina salipaludis]|uniref:Lamin tail domain-containing protein n=1 Tax=Ancylomarina salipaludis TaxID=2501299 RepID=A0A4Q1JPX8_9BACT|nr:lamin tail domain-containing protein [Ancylomarina salipaludis]RXQ96516.1 lamin tail domain-containing protein [Ancylomarina salipaludis]
MKTHAFIKVLFLLFLIMGSLQAQNVIYTENFNDDIGKGFDGDVLNDISDVNWTLDVSTCILNDADDYVKVVDTGSDRLEALDCNGEAIWKSPVLNISSYTGINISVSATETGTGSNADNKYIKLFYVLDGGVEVPFFESTVDWGSSTATVNGLEGLSLQLVARMKTTYASDKIYIDDILVTGTPIIVSNDGSTQAQVVDWIPADSLISSLAVAEDDYKEVFRFQISDAGDDDLESILKKIRLIPGDVNTVNWANEIGGLQLRINDKIVNADYQKSEIDLIITFPDTEVAAIIPDGETIDLSLYIYLTENSIDGSIFQAAIESTHTQWELTGSDWLAEFPGNLVGKSFVVDVVGTELIFTDKPPKTVIPNENFELGVKSIDTYGNQDLVSNIQAKVSVASGTGELASDSGLQKNLITGKYTWTDLSYNKAENFTILVEAEGLKSVMSENISSLDANSIILKADSAIPSKKLSSLAISLDDSEVVLNFGIKDEATFDSTPTLISSMKFYNSLNDSGLDWKKHLAGAVLLKAGEIIAQTTKIEKDNISFTSLDVEIENGTEVEYELGVYFKKSLLPDHAEFQVEIRNDHDWKSSTTGSSLLSELAEPIVSALHKIEVISDRLSFISVPKGIAPGEEFALILAAVDICQNIDEDQNSLVNLNLISGDGTLSQTGAIGHLVDGQLRIDGLTYSGRQSFELQASGDLASAVQSVFVQNESLILSDDFESPSLNLWENITDWTVSTYLPIEGTNSLKHNLTNAIGDSYILQPISEIQIGSESIYWEFILKNSDWDPSSTNFFVFHLLMDFNGPELADQFYSVGVNLSGSDDLLSLWKTNDGDSELLIKSDFDWNEDDQLAIKVEYTAKGEWKLYYNRLGKKENWLEAGRAESEVVNEAETWYTGLEFNFETASRAGELWFDDLTIESYNTPAFLKNYAVYSDSIVLTFSEDLNFLESSKVDYFSLKRDGDDVFIKEINASNKKNELILQVQEKLRTGKYNLSFEGIQDLFGSVSDRMNIEFDFYEKPKQYDLVINEILADESPLVGLPEYEFIELYNRSAYPINIGNFKLKVGQTEKDLSAFELAADDYLILCSNAAVDLYSNFGNVLGVSGFPALSNSGATVSITSSSGLLIDKIEYSSGWYQDENKKDGGWSLERIDSNNHSWQADNWQASMDESGGTPGRQNSIAGINPDVISPRLLSFDLINSNTIDFFFSEDLELTQALMLENFSLDQEMGHPDSVVEFENEKFALRLTFPQDFEHNIQYRFQFSDLLVDLAGNSMEEKAFEFLLADLPQSGDLVINEVLFNPYPGGADYIELLNISDRIIDIRDLFLANRDEDYQIDQIYPLSDQSQMLEAGTYLLVSTDTANIKLNYSHCDEKTFLQLKNLPSYNDDEGRVVLLNGNQEPVDDFAYDKDMHIQNLTSDEGVSLERINPFRETYSISNWISAAQSIGFGTPGLQNSSYDIDEVEINTVGFKSKTFSPDNDGVDDRLIINFDLDKSGYVANIRVYNSFGYEVRRLASNLTLSTEDELFWDGLLANKDRAPIGIYVIYFELYHPDGDVKTYKKTCVLGGKLK